MDPLADPDDYTMIASDPTESVVDNLAGAANVILDTGEMPVDAVTAAVVQLIGGDRA
jgi:hypothetical protein